MHSHSKKDIEKLNDLINEANGKLTSYNSLMKPIVDAKLELARHQRLFKSCKTQEQENQESTILHKLEEQLKSLKTSMAESGKLNEELNTLFSKIESLEIQIYGHSDRSSPSFLQVKK